MQSPTYRVVISRPATAYTTLYVNADTEEQAAMTAIQSLNELQEEHYSFELDHTHDVELDVEELILN